MRLSPIARLLLLLSTLAFGGSGATAQSSQPTTSDQARSQPRVTAKDSIVVGAHSTPEEVQEGKINDAHQLLYHPRKQTDCAQIRKLCETEIIPMANAAKSEATRSMFLCRKQGHRRYTGLAGHDDSDYPLNYRLVGSARIGQEK